MQKGFRIDEAEWCFHLIPCDQKPLAEEYEYIRSRPEVVKGLAEIYNRKRHPDRYLLDEYFEQTRRIKRWQFLFRHVDVSGTPWLRLPDEVLIRILTPGSSTAAQVIPVGEAFQMFVRHKPFGELIRRCEISPGPLSISDWLVNPYSRGKDRFLLESGREVLVLEVDWQAATKSDIAIAIDKLVKQMQVPPLPIPKKHKGGIPSTGLDYLSMNRLCGPLRMSSKEARAWVVEEKRRDSRLDFRQYRESTWRNHRTLVRARFEKLFPGLIPLLRKIRDS